MATHQSLEDLRASLADRYEIEREIGAGGMAIVYLVRDIRHKREFALKVLNPELGAVLGTEGSLCAGATTNLYFVENWFEEVKKK